MIDRTEVIDWLRAKWEGGALAGISTNDLAGWTRVESEYALTVNAETGEVHVGVYETGVPPMLSFSWDDREAAIVALTILEGGS